MNNLDCEFNKSMRTEIKNKFYNNKKNEYYGIMNILNTNNICGTFLKIYRNTVVLDYIDDYLKDDANFNEMKLEYNECYSDEIADKDDMRKKLINYYKFLCVNEYLEKFEIPDNNNINISKNDSENIYYLELPRNIQEDPSNINKDDNAMVFYEINPYRNEKIEFYNSRGFLSLGVFGRETKNFLEYINSCLRKKYSEKYPEINHEYIKTNLWKVKSRPTIPQSNGGKRKTMRNKKVHRKRKTMKRAKMRRTRHRKRVNSRHSKK